MSVEEQKEMAESLDKLRPAPILIDVIDAEEAERIFQMEREAEDERRLPLLFRRYGIREDDYRSLAIALARRHVKGFQYRKPKTGNNRNLAECCRVVGWVEKKLREGAKTLDQAFDHLIAAGGPYEDRQGERLTMRKRYERSKQYLLDAGYNPKTLHAECCQALEHELDPPDLGKLGRHLKTISKKL
jgi:hypothetical protein